MPHPSLLTALVRSILAGEPAVDDIVARCSHTLGRTWRWLRPLVRRYVEAFEGQTRPRHREVVEFLLNDDGFEHASSKYRNELSVKHWLAEPPTMQPLEGAE